jgi:hypothetical protein
LYLFVQFLNLSAQDQQTDKEVKQSDKKNRNLGRAKIEGENQ